MIDAFNAIAVQFLDFFRQNGAASSTKNPDMTGVSLVQEVLHVFEVLHMSALVRSHGNRLRILLNGAIDHLVNASIMAEVNHFAS